MTHDAFMAEACALAGRACSGSHKFSAPNEFEKIGGVARKRQSNSISIQSALLRFATGAQTPVFRLRCLECTLPEANGRVAQVRERGQRANLGRRALRRGGRVEGERFRDYAFREAGVAKLSQSGRRRSRTSAERQIQRVFLSQVSVQHRDANLGHQSVHLQKRGRQIWRRAHRTVSTDKRRVAHSFAFFANGWRENVVRRSRFWSPRARKLNKSPPKQNPLGWATRRGAPVNRKAAIASRLLSFRNIT